MYARQLFDMAVRDECERKCNLPLKIQPKGEEERIREKSLMYASYSR